MRIWSDVAIGINVAKGADNGSSKSGWGSEEKILIWTIKHTRKSVTY